jgi:hypothetical protein
MLTWQRDDVATAGWLFVGEYGDDTCPFMANNMRTRGPIGGRHVSPHFWLFDFLVQKIGGRGV